MARETDLMNLMNRIESLESRIRFLSRLETLNYTDWTSYTPTVTYAGGTTDPTGITTDFHYAIIGNVLFILGSGYLTRGSGDQTYTRFTLPIAVSESGGVSVSAQYATVGYGETRVDPINDRIVVNHSGMSSDGNYWISAFAKI